MFDIPCSVIGKKVSLIMSSQFPGNPGPIAGRVVESSMQWFKLDAFPYTMRWDCVIGIEVLEDEKTDDEKDHS